MKKKYKKKQSKRQSKKRQSKKRQFRKRQTRKKQTRKRLRGGNYGDDNKRDAAHLKRVKEAVELNKKIAEEKAQKVEAQRLADEQAAAQARRNTQERNARIAREDEARRKATEEATRQQEADRERRDAIIAALGETTPEETAMKNLQGEWKLTRVELEKKRDNIPQHDRQTYAYFDAYDEVEKLNDLEKAKKGRWTIPQYEQFKQRFDEMEAQLRVKPTKSATAVATN